jgi:membrane protein implicated in regulation of membrane protease activity
MADQHESPQIQLILGLIVCAAFAWLAGTGFGGHFLRVVMFAGAAWWFIVSLRRLRAIMQAKQDQQQKQASPPQEVKPVEVLAVRDDEPKPAPAADAKP